VLINEYIRQFGGCYSSGKASTANIVCHLVCVYPSGFCAESNNRLLNLSLTNYILVAMLSALVAHDLAEDCGSAGDDCVEQLVAKIGDALESVADSGRWYVFVFLSYQQCDVLLFHYTLFHVGIMSTTLLPVFNPIFALLLSVCTLAMICGSVTRIPTSTYNFSESHNTHHVSFSFF